VSEARRQPWTRRDLLLGVAGFLVGLGAAVAMHWPALTHEGIFKDDSVQAPHWAAYHATTFQPDDLVLRYATFNESPLQNAIYWIGTWFVESLTLGKILGVASYGLLSLFFYVVGRAMHGTRFGLLLALFITFFPDQWDYSAGFFSKFWAIPLLLVCVFLLQTGRWRGFVALLPFAAVAYPSVAVLIGMVASVYWIQELCHRSGRARELFRYLAIGSALALALLLFKYGSPPEFIGTMRPGAELEQMPEVRRGGYPSRYVPIPSFDSELVGHLEDPFILLNVVLFFLVLGRRGVAWERSWTALLLASAIGYVLADYFFMRLYIPNRYTRYSLAVLLALWNARNWDLILARVNRRFVRYALVAVLLVVGGFAYGASFEHDRGWTDRREMTPVSRFIRMALPEGILVAGSPKQLDDVMVQGRRSVSCPYNIAHPWFTDYYDEMRERTRATLRAHFASGPEPINELHRRYGVTHFLVDKRLFEYALKGKRLFAEPYNGEIYEELGERRDFYLWPAPPDLYIWDNGRYALIQLPIGTAPKGGPVEGSSR